MSSHTPLSTIADNKYAIMLRKIYLVLIISLLAVSIYLMHVISTDRQLQQQSIFSIPFTRANLPRPPRPPLASESNRRLPDAVIIGAKKCGTRALLEMIALHSSVVSAKEEIHFYDRKLSKGIQWYLESLPLARPDQILIEKTPGYFVTPYAPRQMSALKASTLIILIIKDPIERLISDYAQLSSKHDNYSTFNQFVLFSNGELRVSYRPISTGVYITHLREWLAYFKTNQIIIINGERLITEPWVEMERLQKFLGLRREITQNTFAFNKSKGFYCWEYLSNSSSKTTKIKCLGDNKGRVHPVIDRRVRLKLEEHYELANNQLFKLLNKTKQNVTFSWNY